MQDILIEEGSYKGLVRFRSDVLYYHTKITSEYIEAVVAGDYSFERIKSGVKQIDPANNSERSALAWGFLIEEVKKELGENISLEKSELGYPVLIQNSKVLDIPVSLSHDGNFAAFSMHI